MAGLGKCSHETTTNKERGLIDPRSVLFRVRLKHGR
jgi:hypothetical protein